MKGNSASVQAITGPTMMSELVSSHDWASTPLGHVASWPDSLKAAVRILITSRFPMWMAWGPDYTFLYTTHTPVPLWARSTRGHLEDPPPKCGRRSGTTSG